MRNILIVSGLIFLTACSGGRDRTSVSVTRGATGEISRACMAAGRSAATPALCACVQAVANSELSASDRNRAARFFAEPELANSARFSNPSGPDAFWHRYRAFTDKARQQCG